MFLHSEREVFRNGRPVGGKPLRIARFTFIDEREIRVLYAEGNPQHEPMAKRQAKVIGS